MAELDAEKRNRLAKATFGLPGERKYPMPDKSHAANAKARAAQQLKAGNISPAQYKQVIAKANTKLGKHSEPDADDKGGPSDNDMDNK